MDVIPATWWVLGLAVPVLVAGAVRVLAGRVTGKGVERWWAYGWVLATGLGAGLVIAATLGVPDPLWPLQNAGWLLAAVGAVAVIEMVGWALSGGQGRRWIGWGVLILAGGVVAALPWLLCMPLIEHAWSRSETVAWLVTMVPGMVGWWLGCRAAGDVRAGWDWPLGLGVVCVGGGMVLAMSANVSLGLVLAGMGCVMWTATLAGVGSGGGSGGGGGGWGWSAGASSVPLVVLGGVLILAYHYGPRAYQPDEAVSRYAVLLLLAGPAVGGLASLPLPGRRDLRPWLRSLVRLTLMAATTAAAVWLAYTAFAAAEADPYGYG